MEFHFYLPQLRLGVDDIVQRARTAEESGFAGIAFMDHLVPPMAEDKPMLDAMTIATWVAAHTSHLTLGHLVLCDAMRHPAVFAKQAITLDHASHGRFEIGLGWGSQPGELQAFGIDAGDASARVGRMGETLEVLSALWTGKPVDYDGRYHHLTNAQQMPTPVAGRIPILIGGAGPRTMTLVAEHADWWNLQVNFLDRLDELRASAGEARVSIQVMVAYIDDERSRDEVTQQATRRYGMLGDGLLIGNARELSERFAQFEERGIERVYVWFSDFAPPSTIAGFGAEVASQW